MPQLLHLRESDRAKPSCAHMLSAQIHTLSPAVPLITVKKQQKVEIP